jgi:hypothetical protein
MLLALAVVGLGTLSVAGRNWVASWQGLDQLNLAVNGVEYDPDERALIVSTTFLNNSDQQIQIIELDTGLRLSGRSITGGSQRYAQQTLDPGEDVDLETTQRVPNEDAPLVEEHIESSEGTWNVNGRVRVAVSDLSDPVWLPFLVDIEVQ